MWTETNNKLHRQFVFDNFTDAFSFMTRVAAEAEKLNHHPTWTNTYNKVDIWLTTHSAGNVVTEKDHALSVLIDAAIG